MPTYYLAIESFENYCKAPENSYGFSERYRTLASTLRPGDLIVDYVKGCGFSCVMEVTQWPNGDVMSYRPDLKPPEDPYSYRVAIKTLREIDKCEQMPPWRNLRSSLEFGQGKGPQVLRRHLRQIPEQDFNVIADAIQAARQ